MGRTDFYLALAEDHADEAVRLAARVIASAEAEARKPVPRHGPPSQFFYAGARHRPVYARIAAVCEKHGVTWEQIDHAAAVAQRIVRA